MNNQKPQIKKLSGLRTFSSDQTRENNPTSDEDSLQSSINNDSEIQGALAVKKAPEPVPHYKAPKKNVIKENIVVAEKSKPLPPPPAMNSSRVDIASENEDAASATIITDTKKDRFRLFPAIADSIKKWIADYKKAQQIKKMPKYTVPETTRRKGVIQKATSQTGKTTTADHETIQDRIRERQERAEESEKNKKTTTWTPNTEPGFPLLEDSNEPDISIKPHTGFVSSQKEIVIDDLKSIKTASIEKTVVPVPAVDLEVRTKGPVWETALEDVHSVKTVKNTPSIPDTKKPEDTANKVAPKPEAKQEIKTVATAKTEASTPKPEPIPAPPKIVAMIQSPKVPQVEVVAEPPVNNTPSSNIGIQIKEIQQQNKPPSKNLLFSSNTNTLAFGIASIILILGIGAFLGNLWLKNSLETNIISDDNTQIINTKVDLVFQPVTSRADFVAKILSEYKSNQGHVKQFAFTTTDENKNLIKPSSLLLYLNINLNVNFSQSITHLYFGSIRNTEPFIAIKTTDSVASIGGMLLWEETMRDDLAEIFELSNSENSDYRFRDGTLSGIDVRVLKNNNGEEEIIYGFTDSNTVIITTDSSALGDLITLTK